MAKKILLINGGGAFGLIPAYFLSLIEAYTCQDFREPLDCLAGSSIGGILAATYSVGHHPQVVKADFTPACEQIFKKRIWAKCNPLASPKYDDKKLVEFINSYTGGYTIADIRKKYPKLSVFFAGLDATEDYFKVWDNITGKDDAERLSDICRITCAAPTYFDAVDRDGHAMIDCGVIDNTMILTTTTGYKSKCGVDFEDMDVMLIGTGFLVDEQPLTAKRYNSLNQLGILYNLIIPYVTQSNELASIFWARHLGLRNFYYFNPVVIKGELDDASQLPGVMNECYKYDHEFIRMWKDFLSDEKKDPDKQVSELIMLPAGHGGAFQK